MPALSINEAAERLAKWVEKAKPSTLLEIYAELFPDIPAAAPPSAANLARHIRGGLKAEKIVTFRKVSRGPR